MEGNDGTTLVIKKLSLFVKLMIILISHEENSKGSN